MTRLYIDIVTFSKIKKKGTGTKSAEDYVLLYNGIENQKIVKAGLMITMRKGLANRVKKWYSINRIIKEIREEDQKLNGKMV